MNGLLPTYHSVVQSVHEELIQKADEQRAIRESQEIHGTSLSMRSRLGRMMIRAGARLSPGLEREQPTVS